MMGLIEDNSKWEDGFSLSLNYAERFLKPVIMRFLRWVKNRLMILRIRWKEEN